MFNISNVFVKGSSNVFSSLSSAGQFPCTDDCQVTFVNLKCDSSKKRRRGRKSPSKEVSHITAEFEMEMKEEEASGSFKTPFHVRYFRSQS